MVIIMRFFLYSKITIMRNIQNYYKVIIIRLRQIMLLSLVSETWNVLYVKTLFLAHNSKLLSNNYLKMLTYYLIF